MSSLLGPIGTLKGRGAAAAGAPAARPAAGSAMGGMDLGFDDDDDAPRGKRSAMKGGKKKAAAATEAKKKPVAKPAAKPTAAAAGGGGVRQPPRPGGGLGGGLGGGGLSSMLKDPMAIDFGDDDLSISDMDADLEIDAPVGSEGSDAWYASAACHAPRPTTLSAPAARTQGTAASGAGHARQRLGVERHAGGCARRAQEAAAAAHIRPPAACRGARRRPHRRPHRRARARRAGRARAEGERGARRRAARQRDVD